MTAVLHTEARNVLNLLLLHLSTHKKRVLGGVKIVAGIKRSVSIESEQNIVSGIFLFDCYNHFCFRPTTYILVFMV